jgi:hypothetical protein
LIEKLFAVIFPTIPITRAIREEVIIWLGILGEIEGFTRIQNFGGREFYLYAMMVCPCIFLIVTCSASWHAGMFAASSLISIWHFILRENGLIGAFRNAGTAIDAGVGINVVPGILVLRVSRNNALYWADLYTAAIA